MFLTILILASIGVLAIVIFIVWLFHLSVQRGQTIEELRIRISMNVDRMDHFSREIEDLKRNVSLLEDERNVKAKPRKR
jgi:cell division protein FtsL